MPKIEIYVKILTCEKCGHFLILYEGDPMCPKCKRLTLLDTETAIKVATRLVSLLNFDDGRKTQFTQAKPILDKYGFKATFYVVCNYVGKPGYMNWDQIRQLNEGGHDIGSHSMNHAVLSNLSK